MATITDLRSPHLEEGTEDEEPEQIAEVAEVTFPVRLPNSISWEMGIRNKHTALALAA